MPRPPKEKKKHICTQLKEDGTVCGTVWRSPAQLIYHTRTHTGEKPEICTELDVKTGKPCGRGFDKPSNLKKHINVVHKGIKDHVCEHVFIDEKRKGQVCGASFGRKQGLCEHMVDHTGVFPFVCKHLKDEDGEMCGYVCKRVQDMAEHVMATHTDKTSTEYLEFREKDNKYVRERRAKDVEYRVSKLMGRSFGHFRKRRGGETVTSLDMQFVLGKSWAELVVHLHNNPHGYTLDMEGMEIDHIRSMWSFLLTNCPVEEHRCMNFNNLQLLPGPENRAKGNYYNAAEYAITDASIAIEKLVPGWICMHYSG
ncbi:hypothetical protein T484DRAFT_1758217 [Baffinella frigidus]|nr:hypothetical protein T484DRAFT_1758217 [Cryptophyta sp. CCMP2293]